MTMTTMPESLNSPVSGKAVFMEFGPPNQQMPPSPMSHGHYSMHCLHSAQHDTSYSGASSFSRPLAYPYVNSVSSHTSNPYISTVQPYPNSSSLSQSRLEEPGTVPSSLLLTDPPTHRPTDLPLRPPAATHRSELRAQQQPRCAH